MCDDKDPSVGGREIPFRILSAHDHPRKTPRTSVAAFLAERSHAQGWVRGAVGCLVVVPAWLRSGVGKPDACSLRFKTPHG
eukprot:1526353-Prymnesium_polylepis.1